MKTVFIPVLFLALSSVASAQGISCTASLLGKGTEAQSAAITIADEKEHYTNLEGDVKVVFQKTARFKNYIDTRIFKDRQLLLMTITKAQDAHTEILVPLNDAQISVSCTQGIAF